MDEYLFGTYRKETEALKDLRVSVSLIAKAKGLGTVPSELSIEEHRELLEASSRLDGLPSDKWLELVSKCVRNNGQKL